MISQDQALQLITGGLAALGIDPLPPPSLARLWSYFTELIKWNRSINLVAKASDQEIIENHFIDSLTLLPEIHSGPMLDVGSGAGFPGLVLKIARPELEITLAEPRQKRVSFLRHIIRTLGLTGISVTDQRLIPGDSGFAETHGQFPAITCRALTEISLFLDMVTGISPPNGLIFCMKGPRANEELNEWMTHFPDSPFVLERCATFTLPISGAERNLVIFKNQGPGKVLPP